MANWKTFATPIVSLLEVEDEKNSGTKNIAISPLEQRWVAIVGAAYKWPSWSHLNGCALCIEGMPIVQLGARVPDKNMLPSPTLCVLLGCLRDTRCLQLMLACMFVSRNTWI